MKFTPASLPSLIAFGMVLLFEIGMFLAAIYYASRRLLEKPWTNTLLMAFLLGLWLMMATTIVHSGVLQAYPIPTVPLFHLSLLSVAVLFGFSHWGAKIALSIPLMFIVAFHVFRLPLELVMASWAEQGTIPMTMTVAGKNFDVLTGLFALTIAPLAGTYRRLTWIFNITGMLLLLNVIYVSVMSSPFKFTWGVQPPLQLVFYMPYALIGPVCIGGALAGHIILTRALLYH